MLLKCAAIAYEKNVNQKRRFFMWLQVKHIVENGIYECADLDKNLERTNIRTLKYINGTWKNSKGYEVKKPTVYFDESAGL